MKLTRGVSLGAWTRPDQQGTVAEYEQRLGSRLHNVAFFPQWGHPIGLASLQALPSGAMPLPNVNLPYGGATQQNMDALLRELDLFKHPLIIRYAGEMDRPRLGVILDPQRFKHAWNAVRSYIQARYPMAEFAWCPTAMGLDPHQGLRADAYWPGVDEVDWPSLDGYDVAGSNERSFQEIMQPGVDYYRQRAPGRMVAVLETGVTRVGRSDEYRRGWIVAMAAALSPGGALPEIKVVTMFDAAPPAEAGVDWRLPFGSSAWAAWAAVCALRWFKSRPWIVQ